MSYRQSISFALLLTSLCCAHSSSSSAFTSQDAEKPTEHAVDSLAQTAVLLIAVDENGNTTSGGTGFFLRSRDRLFVVTARHVIEAASDVQVLVNRSGVGTASFSASRFAMSQNGPVWMTHLQSDLAALEIDQSKLPGLEGKVVLGDMLPANRVRLLDQVVAAGFPYLYGSNGSALGLAPVVQMARVVSWPSIGANRDEVNVLIDPPLYPGFSGAPVFSMDNPVGSAVLRQRITELVGVYVGNLRLGDPKDDRPDQHLGRVVPIEFLLEMLGDQR